MMVVLGGGPALADQIGDLTKTVTSSSNEKARLAAVVSLAQLRDKRAMKPLVTALADPSAKIRAVAAVALGQLGHKAALPSLRTTANDDADLTVRARAKTAAIAVAKSNRLPHPFSEPATELAVVEPKKQGRAGFGNAPRALEPKPDLYVVIKSSADDSPGKADKKTRKVNADIVRQVLADHCRSAPNVTSVAADAQRWGLDLRTVDLSVVKLDVVQSGAYVEVDAQLRLAISDDKGKMLSFVSGGAKVQVPKAKFDARYLPNLRKEALENAMRGMFDKLLAHLRERPQS
jgi:hypothetical protein